MRFLRFIAIAALAHSCMLAGALAPACAEKRVALVIGNSTYANIPRLRNPANDARLMADTLRTLGFTLIGGKPLIDLNKASLDSAVRNFGAQLPGAEIALFYYAGHGLQLHGTNYLVPVEANVVREADAEFEMLNVNLVLQQMDPGDRPDRRLNVVILDACRNNPFGGRGLRSADRGLGVMDAPAGTLISFATQPGAAARDGDGDHSPFTKALADSIRRPGLGLFDVFNEVGLGVQRATDGAQRPWVSNSPIAGHFYFAGLPQREPAPAPAANPAVSEAGRLWESVKNTTSLAALDDFIQHYGTVPVYGPLARAKREELAKLAVPPPAAPQRPPHTSVVPPPAVPRPPPPWTGAATPLTAAQERGLQSGQTFAECENCPEMVVVPAGRFTMGAPPGEFDDDRQRPWHDVTIGKAFAAGRLHVTVDQYAAFVRETGYEAISNCWTLEGGKWADHGGRSWRNPGFAQEGTHPVVCVSWTDVQAYVNWLAKKTGKPYRLLSEAEFEYAARGRTSSGTYPRNWFGNDRLGLCKYGNISDLGNLCDHHDHTSPAGHYAPNPFGLFDMFGNAWQWTADCWHDNYEGAPRDGSAWTKACSRNERVVRGGAWYSPDETSAASRERTTDIVFPYGFRVARTLTP